MKDKSDRGYKPMAFCKPPDVFVSVRQEVEVKNNLTDAPPQMSDRGGTCVSKPPLILKFKKINYETFQLSFKEWLLT